MTAMSKIRFCNLILQRGLLINRFTSGCWCCIHGRCFSKKGRHGKEGLVGQEHRHLQGEESFWSILVFKASNCNYLNVWSTISPWVSIATNVMITVSKNHRSRVVLWSKWPKNPSRSWSLATLPTRMRQFVRIMRNRFRRKISRQWRGSTTIAPPARSRRSAASMLLTSKTSLSGAIILRHSFPMRPMPSWKGTLLQRYKCGLTWARMSYAW